MSARGDLPRMRTLAFFFFIAFAAHGADPLPSWNESATKKALVDYVERTTTPGSPDFIPEPARIAVFDNDGTLWPENPQPFQVIFCVDELRRQLPSHPEWKDDAIVQDALAGNFAPLFANHYAGVFHVFALAGDGLTTDEFAARVTAWFQTARHPKFGRPYDRLAYQPMLEVLEWIRSRGFTTFIVSGGGADFMRVFSERVYGIIPRQVVGTTSRPIFELRDSGPVLVRTSDHVFVDDGPNKPVGIFHFIGSRPVLCFGNSDGDLQMLQYTTIANPRPAAGFIVHHDDATREYAYDAHPQSSGRLVEALDQAPQRGWHVISMKNDWKNIFPSDE